MIKKGIIGMAAGLFFILFSLSIFLMSVVASETYSENLLQWPTDYPGVVNSGYGIRESPLTSEKEFHQALDMYCNLGDSIYASATGYVIDADMYEWGNTIEIEHTEGIRTRYVHMDELLVEIGDYVYAGQEIAKCGSTGWSTGDHLHFAVKKDGKLVNPNFLLIKE